MAICPECGFRTEDFARFCPMCGYKLPEEAVNEPIEEAVNEPIEEAVNEPIEEAETAVIEEGEPVPGEETEAVPVEEEIPAALPAYAQPRKKKKWWIAIVVIAAAALLALSALNIHLLASRVFGLGKDLDLGVYTATGVEMWNMSMDVEQVFDGGLSIELLEDGICYITIGGSGGEGTWSVTDGVLTINDGYSDLTGTLADGVMELENAESMGLRITLIRADE